MRAHESAFRSERGEREHPTQKETVEKASPAASSRADLFALAALCVQLAVILRLRIVAWPEVTTPGYLWSRGLLMYRDILREHTPGATGLLASLFWLFGARTAVLAAFAAVGPLAAHAFLLRETRRLRLPIRALSSAFFHAVFFASDGNAVWPTVLMSALAIPIAAAASRGRFARAGLLLGLAILLKQTAAYTLALMALWLLAQKRPREAARLFVAACLPYFVTLAAFALLGAGGDMLRWTIWVPLTVKVPVATFQPGFWTAAMVLFGFLPLVVEAALERPGEYATSARWLLVVAAGLALICYPRFDLLQTVASVPCLAIGAARLVSRRPPLLSRCAAAFVLTLTVSRAAVVVAGSHFDGKVLFWNEEPAFNALVAKLRELPRETPLHSELWGNVLPRSGLLPPGRLWVHPWFDWFLPVDRAGQRIRKAAGLPGTVVVGYRGTHPGGERIGPYAIWRVENAAPPHR
jgi:hypothetical protein